MGIVFLWCFSSVDFVAKREGKVGLTERTDREWGKRA